MSEAAEKKLLCNHNLDEPVYHPCKDCPWNGKVKCPYYVEDEEPVFIPSEPRPYDDITGYSKY